MDMTLTSPEIVEEPLFVEGRAGGSLFGVLTRAPAPRGVTVVTLPGGGLLGSTHRNDLAVRLCRRLAASGFDAVRIDWHGVGDSTGFVRRFELDEPFVDDVLGVVSSLHDLGHDRIALFGTCFGARTALAASQSLRQVVALFLVSLPVASASHKEWVNLAQTTTVWELLGGRLRKMSPSMLFSARRRRALKIFLRTRLSLMLHRSGDPQGSALEKGSGGRVAAELAHAISGGTEVDLVYGDEDDYFADFRSLSGDRWERLLRDDRLRIQVIPGEVHRFQWVEAQEAVLDAVQDWADTRLTRLASGRGGTVHDPGGLGA